MYSGAGQLLYASILASKLLLKDSLSVRKPVKNVFFQQNQVQYRDFCVYIACLVRCIIHKQCVSQQNVINKLEAERVDRTISILLKIL